MKGLRLLLLAPLLAGCTLINSGGLGLDVVRVAGGLEVRNLRDTPLDPVVLTASGPGLTSADPRCTLALNDATVSTYTCRLSAIPARTAWPVLFRGTVTSANALTKADGQLMPPALLN